MKGGIFILYEKIKDLCKQNKISVAELERILQFGNGTIQRWKIAQPTLEKVKMVADYLNVSIDYLTGKEMFSAEHMNILKEYISFTPNQKALIQCYFTLIKNGQAV